MPSMLGRQKLNGGILADSGGQEGSVGDEGVILRGDHQHGRADLGGDAFRADVFVIVLRVAIAEFWRSDDVIELTHGSNRWKAANREARREQFMLSGVPGHQATYKAALVKIIFRALEGVGAGCEVESGANSADAAQSLRHGGAKLSRHLGHQISTHRVAGEKDLLKTVGV